MLGPALGSAYRTVDSKIAASANRTAVAGTVRGFMWASGHFSCAVSKSAYCHRLKCTVPPLSAPYGHTVATMTAALIEPRATQDWRQMFTTGLSMPGPLAEPFTVTVTGDHCANA